MAVVSWKRNTVSGYATVSREQLIESGTLYVATTSAPKAELFAITRALELGKELWLNIFTDFAYTFHVVHAYAATWK